MTTELLVTCGIIFLVSAVVGALIFLVSAVVGALIVVVSSAVTRSHYPTRTRCAICKSYGHTALWHVDRYHTY